MSKEQTDFNELSQSFAAISTTFKETLAKVDKSQPSMDEKMQQCMSSMYAMISNVHDRIDNFHRDMYNYTDSHSVGHLPKIVGADKMNKALAALGMDGDFQAQKKTIFASKDLFEIKRK